VTKSKHVKVETVCNCQYSSEYTTQTFQLFDSIAGLQTRRFAKYSQVLWSLRRHCHHRHSQKILSRL